MKEINRKWFVILLCSIVIISLFEGYIKRDKLHEAYLILFHKSAIMAHYNSNRQLDGEYITYINGNVYIKSYFKNGLREGWCIWYDDTTWKKKDEVFYKNGKADGIENVYYKNGNLNYSTHWRNERYCESEYHYLDNGTLNNAFDESKNVNNGYCYIAYDSAGNFHQILGDVFSSFIYSKFRDSIVALTDNIKYSGIKDLYINVATPPQLTNVIDVFINNVRVNKAAIKENLMLIPNVFNNAGTYNIVIYGKLLIKNGKAIKTDTLKTTIIKE